jgi:hypothetical protein
MAIDSEFANGDTTNGSKRKRNIGSIDRGCGERAEEHRHVSIAGSA